MVRFAHHDPVACILVLVLVLAFSLSHPERSEGSHKRRRVFVIVAGLRKTVSRPFTPG